VDYYSVPINMPIALAFTAPLLNPDRKLANFFMRPAVRAALASYILMVAVVYHVLIVPYWNPQGVTWLTATGLNTVMPILYIVDWLFFAKKRPIFYKNLPY